MKTPSFVRITLTAYNLQARYREHVIINSYENYFNTRKSAIPELWSDEVVVVVEARWVRRILGEVLSSNVRRRAEGERSFVLKIELVKFD
jgi:hypothetical protein